MVCGSRMTPPQAMNSEQSLGDLPYCHHFSFWTIGFSILTNSLEVQEGAKRFFRQFPAGTNSLQGCPLVLQLLWDDRVKLYDLYRNGEKLVSTREQGHVFTLIDMYVLNHFRTLSSEHWVMHAGMVARGGKGILLPGGTTHGKSTLTAMLVHGGFDYLGDEHVILDRNGSLTVWAFPRPIVLREDSYAKVKEIAPALEAVVTPFLFQGKGDYYIDPEALRPGSVAPEARLSHIVFPHYAPDLSPALVPVSKAEAVMLLLRGFLHFKHFRGAAVEGLSDIAERVPCYSLVTGKYEETVSLIDELASSNGPQPDS